MESEEKKWLSELFQICINLRIENEDLKEQMSNIWKPINTAPFKERVIVLFKGGNVSTMIFDDSNDFRTTYATHWMPLPSLPK